MKKSFFFIIAITFSYLQARSQSSFLTTEYVDVNNIRASVEVHGDMWSIPGVLGDSLAACEFPQGSGKNVMGAGSLWMTGYDAGHDLHVAAQTYRQDGNDYWPGPLDNNDTITYAASHDWAKIWKVNYSDIQAFLMAGTHTLINTPPVILQWPAKGNPYAAGNNNAPLIINTDMAPFVDVNNDGIYNALQGDYPLMKGDQMLWWVYNDNGGLHQQSQGPALKVEVHAMAYAYHRYTLIDNVIYYQFEITNKSQNTYDSFRVAQFEDEDIGSPWDDNVGYDSTWRMGFGYNDTAYDDIYGTNIPVAGITLIHLPGDNGNSIAPIGSFVYFYNDFSQWGNPNNGVQFNNNMHGRFRNGAPFYSAAYINNALTACDSFHGADKRIVMSTQDMTFAPGETKTIVEALVVANAGTGNTCPNISITGISTVADTAWAVYNNPPAPTIVNNVTQATDVITVFPNPVQDDLYIRCSGLTQGQVIITDIAGRVLVSQALEHQAGTNTIDMHEFAGGIYLYRIVDNGIIKKQGKVVKK